MLERSSSRRTVWIRPFILASVQLETTVNIVEGIYTHRLRKVTTSPNFCNAARTCLLSVSERGIGSVVMCTAWAASRERGAAIVSQLVFSLIANSCIHLESRGWHFPPVLASVQSDCSTSTVPTHKD